MNFGNGILVTGRGFISQYDTLKCGSDFIRTIVGAKRRGLAPMALFCGIDGEFNAVAGARKGIVRWGIRSVQ